MTRAIRTHWPALLVVLIVAVGAFLRLNYEAGSAARAIGNFLLQWVAFGILIASYAYRHFDRFRLQVNRAWFRITNPEGTWGLTADIEVLDGRTALKEAMETVEGLAQSRKDALAEGEHRKAWSVNGLTLVVALEDVPDPGYGSDPLEDEKAILRVQVPDLKRPFRSWSKTIEREAAPVIDAVEKAVLPYAGDDRKYVACVGFTGPNPYFGFFVHRVDPTQVARVQIDLREKVGHEAVPVTIHKDRLTIVAESLQTAKLLSIQYLGLVTPRT